MEVIHGVDEQLTRTPNGVHYSSKHAWTPNGVHLLLNWRDLAPDVTSRDRLLLPRFPVPSNILSLVWEVSIPWQMFSILARQCSQQWLLNLLVLEDQLALTKVDTIPWSKRTNWPWPLLTRHYTTMRLHRLDDLVTSLTKPLHDDHRLPCMHACWGTMLGSLTLDLSDGDLECRDILVLLIHTTSTRLWLVLNNTFCRGIANM